MEFVREISCEITFLQLRDNQKERMIDAPTLEEASVKLELLC